MSLTLLVTLEATGPLLIIVEILIVKVIALVSRIDGADTLNVRGRRGIHEDIKVMADLSHGGDDVIVTLGLRIGCLVYISETC